MVYKVKFGEPIETFSVVKKVAESENLDFFSVKEKKNEIIFEYKLKKNDIVFGLGEAHGNLNKRGFRCVNFNTDNYYFSENAPSIYASHNFLIVDGKECFGVFIDTPAKTTFEIDYNQSGKIKVICENKNLNVYIVTGKNAYDTNRQFLKIIGKSFVPPLWAFGLGQSRWGYKTQQDFENVINGYQKNKLPLDYVCMDIDYMDRYIDFTINKNSFPNMKKFVSDCKKKGVNLVPIIDAGIKVEQGNKTYDEGVKNNFFCKDKNGNNFEAYVWPGKTHFVDFLQPKARIWFGKQYKDLLECGFTGFWNDMNEPAIFNMDFFDAQKQKKQIFQKTEDYNAFYHNLNGKTINHNDVHNIYGHLMTMASSNELKKLDERYLLFSRSSFIGSHRYGGVWTGDNFSSWQNLKESLPMLCSMNMCGLIFSGADTGGFAGNCSEQLLLRWLAVSVFTPLFRIHSDISSSPQECYSFGQNDKFRKILSLRYRLLPYIYAEFVKSAMTCDLYLKPLAFVYPNDKQAQNIQDQLFVGQSIMIAPIVEENAVERDVYLPEKMTKVVFDGKNFKCENFESGNHKIHCELDEVVFFIKDKCLVPVAADAQNTQKINLTKVTLLGNGTTYKQYIDDGKTKQISQKNIKILKK